MLSRLIIILLFVPILLTIFLKGDLTFLLFVEIIICVSMYEFFNMLKSKGFEVASRIGIVLGSLLPIFIYLNGKSPFHLPFSTLSKYQFQFDIGGFIVFVLIVISVRQILRVKIKGAMSEISYTLFGIIYIAYLFSYILLIKNHFPNGRIWVLTIFLLIWSCDIFAYLVGMCIGGKIFKRRLAPKISPKKSIEGAIGGILGVFLVTIYFDRIYIFISHFVCNISFLSNNCSIQYIKIGIDKPKAFLLALVVGISAEIGDLVESKIKREFEIKDSSNLLLGHGGFLDRFDSSLFVLPIVYYFIKFIIY